MGCSIRLFAPCRKEAGPGGRGLRAASACSSPHGASCRLSLWRRQRARGVSEEERAMLFPTLPTVSVLHTHFADGWINSGCAYRPMTETNRREHNRFCVP